MMPFSHLDVVLVDVVLMWFRSGSKVDVCLVAVVVMCYDSLVWCHVDIPLCVVLADVLVLVDEDGVQLIGFS